MTDRTETATCQHEPYHGRCIHCDAPFVGGRPIVPTQGRERQRTVEADAPQFLRDLANEHLQSADRLAEIMPDAPGVAVLRAKAERLKEIALMVCAP